MAEGIKKLQITLIRSTIGRHFSQKQTVEALGFKRLNQVVIKNDCPQIRGMINKVSHLLKVVELS
jgi:large subunit ribosomal protein L30